MESWKGNYEWCAGHAERQLLCQPNRGPPKSLCRAQGRIPVRIAFIRVFVRILDKIGAARYMVIIYGHPRLRMALRVLKTLSRRWEGAYPGGSLACAGVHRCLVRFVYNVGCKMAMACQPFGKFCHLSSNDYLTMEAAPVTV